MKRQHDSWVCLRDPLASSQNDVLNIWKLRRIYIRTLELPQYQVESHDSDYLTVTNGSTPDTSLLEEPVSEGSLGHSGELSEGASEGTRSPTPCVTHSPLRAGASLDPSPQCALPHGPLRTVPPPSKPPSAYTQGALSPAAKQLDIQKAPSSSTASFRHPPATQCRLLLWTDGVLLGTQKQKPLRGTCFPLHNPYKVPSNKLA